MGILVLFSGNNWQILTLQVTNAGKIITSGPGGAQQL